ncbi:MAG: glycosyltransferase, partial [Chloroflexi bacterium]|nr:glycosyltransferase [Chloroflexota bacterium]
MTTNHANYRGKQNFPYDISIVMPVYNEEQNLRPLHIELEEVLADMDIRYEIIYVDDGSRDKSPEVLNDIVEKSHHTKA